MSSAISRDVAIAQEDIDAQRRLTSHPFDIIPHTEVPWVSMAKCSEIFEQNPKRAFSYAKIGEFGDRVKIAALKAMSELQSRLKTPNSSMLIAITKFGVGTCQSFAEAAAASLKVAGIENSIYLLGCENPQKGIKIEGHSFVVFGDGNELEQLNYDETLVKQLSQLRGCYIYDRLLYKRIVKTDEAVRTPEFGAFFFKRGISKLVCIQSFNHVDSASYKSVLAEADQIHDLARQFLPNVVISNALTQPFILKHETHMCATELETLIPGTSWKHPAAKVWCEETQDRVQAYASYLQAHGITVKRSQVKGKESYVLFIDNPDFLQITKLPAFDWHREAMVATGQHFATGPFRTGTHDTRALSKLVASYL